jgi:hypothetical protein
MRTVVFQDPVSEIANVRRSPAWIPDAQRGTVEQLERSIVIVPLLMQRRQQPVDLSHADLHDRVIFTSEIVGHVVSSR